MYARKRNDPETAIRMTEEEYLAFADEQEEKWEWGDGYAYAMVGGTVNHGIITANLIIHLGSQLADKDCTVTSSDVRVHLAKYNKYRYPDVTIFCGEPDYLEGRSDTLTNPAVLVEVISPSSVATDRNEKLTEYTQIKSLEAYVLVSQGEPRIEVFRRFEGEQWLYEYANGLEGQMEVPSLGCVLALSKVYQKVRWGAESNTEPEEKE